MERTDGLGDGWEEHLAVGVRRAELSQSGWWDSADGLINDALAAKEDEQRVMCIGLDGNSVGDEFIGIRGAYAGEFERVATRNELVKANATYMITGHVDHDALILSPYQRRTADWLPSPVSNVATTTAGMVVFLQIGHLSLGGYTGLQISIEHGVTTSNYATKTTYPTYTTGYQGVLRVATGTIRPHVRVRGNFTGGPGANPSADVFVGFKRL